MNSLSRRRFLLASVTAAIVPRFLDAAPDAKSLAAVQDKAYNYLKGRQQADGSFVPQAGEPGLTALIVAGLLRSGKTVDDAVVSKSLKYLEGCIKPDGGIYNKGLANYTTSLAAMAFAEANKSGKYRDALANAAKFLHTLQYGDGSDVPEDDAKYGGAGYDKKGSRGGGADLSNTHFFLEALLAAGTPKDDPAVKRAIVFLGRSQNLPGEFNNLDYAAKVSDDDKGGFVYNTAAVKQDKSEKKTAAGGLRSEGGMTYAGLKSFLYAGVGKDDPRVKAAVNWVRRHYTLDENPGMGANGLFYYYHTFAKAMDALGEKEFTDAQGAKHDWKQELFDKLKGIQKADGSWTNEKSKAFLENLPELATAFAVLALTYCK